MPGVFVFSALLLGLVSSLHCLGMCGPLVLGIIPPNLNSIQKTGVLAQYHGGRLLTYGILGVVAGLVGQQLFMPEVQQYISIGLGVIVLLWVANKYLHFIPNNGTGVFPKVFSKMMNAFMKLPNYLRYPFFGLLNVLLPCGMVYIAMAGAFAQHSMFNSFLFMVFFGVGTLPLLATVSYMGVLLKVKMVKKLNVLRPVFLLIFAGILVIRGLNLGIPYLSPKVTHTDEAAVMECCKKK